MSAWIPTPLQYIGRSRFCFASNLSNILICIWIWLHINFIRICLVKIFIESSVSYVDNLFNPKPYLGHPSHVSQWSRTISASTNNKSLFWQTSLITYRYAGCFSWSSFLLCICVPSLTYSISWHLRNRKLYLHQDG